MKVNEPTKRAHYLPAAYLQNFSVDGRHGKRESMIWWLSSKLHKDVKVEDQCFELNCYSKSRAEEAEAFFNLGEGLYAQLARQIWGGLPNRSTKDYFALIIVIMSLHLRNPSYEVRLPDVERFDAYKLLEQQCAHHILMRGAAGVPTEQELFDALKSKWRVALMREPVGEALITSDNPSLWFSCDQSGDVHFMALPITPYCCAVAFARDVLRVESVDLTARDVTLLNRGQVQSKLKALFSHAPFSDEDRLAAPNILKNCKAPAGFIGPDEWQMNVLSYSNALSFITVA